jgi:dihydrofolate reductase
MDMKVIIIAAKSDNNVIGRDNDLVWDLPADQRFLDEQIKKGLLLTGRKSFESSQGAELFKDTSRVILLTRQEDYQAGQAKIASSLEEALKTAEEHPVQRLCVLGGTSVYKAFMPHTDQLTITEVHETFEGDSYFPEIDPDVWKEIWREDHQKDEENPYDFSFVKYARR